MITKLRLKNFKRVKDQTYEFSSFDLLVGRNNCGKSTILQSLAIWQFCIDQFDQAKRKGSRGVQIVLPNFTALPVPEFNLLWNNKTDREYTEANGRRKQKYILIEIDVEWKSGSDNAIKNFSVQLRYHSRQTVYAIPSQGWNDYNILKKDPDFPRIAYVPPFSGLEPLEKWLDDPPLRQEVGKGQPGSVLRNLLLRVSRSSGKIKNSSDALIPSDVWSELEKAVHRWFSVEIARPQYDSQRDVNIKVEFKQADKNYDIITGGSGFHQALTLLAFLYGYRPTTILFDEPDAHLHVNLQREILDFFKRKSNETRTQFIIATHSEAVINAVELPQIISLLSNEPKRITHIKPVVEAMANIPNDLITSLISSPYIIYVEGENDERIIRSWAATLDAQGIMEKLCFHCMHGGNKELMKNMADDQFNAIKQIIPEVKRMMLFDYDDDSKAFKPDPNNKVLFEWKRKNIDNYLLVPDPWKRAIRNSLLPLFSDNAERVIDDFFKRERLTLQENESWQTVDVDVFKRVDGKSLLFDSPKSLFNLLRTQTSVSIKREDVAMQMTSTEIHNDVHDFFSKLVELCNDEKKDE